AAALAGMAAGRQFLPAADRARAGPDWAADSAGPDALRALPDFAPAAGGRGECADCGQAAAALSVLDGIAPGLCAEAEVEALAGRGWGVGACQPASSMAEPALVAQLFRFGRQRGSAAQPQPEFRYCAANAAGQPRLAAVCAHAFRDCLGGSLLAGTAQLLELEQAPAHSPAGGAGHN